MFERPSFPPTAWRYQYLGGFDQATEVTSFCTEALHRTKLAVWPAICHALGGKQLTTKSNSDLKIAAAKA